MKTVAVRPDESCDDLLRGELRLIQKRRGYRYSVDALLLAQFALPLAAGRVLEAGTGSGVISLILARRAQPAAITAVEIQRPLAGMARRNVRLNRLEGKIAVLHRDLKKLPALFPPASFDLIVSNPPFRPQGTGQLSPDREKAVARHELKLTLAELLAVTRPLLAPGGALCLVYPSSRFSALADALEQAGWFIARTQSAYDRPGGRPRLELIEARTRVVPRTEFPPIYIESEQGKFELAAGKMG